MKPLALRASLLFMVVGVSTRAQPDSRSTGSADPQAETTSSTGLQNMPEEALVQRIQAFQKMLGERQGAAQQPALRIMLWEEAIKHVDALLTRFANSAYAEEATITKLQALAELARSDPSRLAQLLEITAKITREHPGPRLASENAFYAIQGFVLGARREKMPLPRRLQGTVERYTAFLEDYPKSERVPIIRASLIRNLIALYQPGKSASPVDRARRELALLQRDYPGHRATQRATGELYRVDAIGKPFAFDHTTSDGKRIKSQDYLGKVLVVHFWATWSAASRNALPELIDLYRKHKERGLQFVGVNVDKSRDQIGKALDTFNMSWPQYFDEKGLENDALVSMGVVSVPVYYVVDRQGILRHISRGGDLPALIEPLLAEPAKKR